MQTNTIDRVRSIVNDGTISRTALARAAGLHPNSLRDCLNDSWNPTTETLGKLDAFLAANEDVPVMVGPEEIIDEARNGRMFVLVDDEDRENEGDLVIPAQMATPAAINFMATHGRGLICLSLTKQRVKQLGIDMMSSNNRTVYETAFTTSIEAREGVTTGISAGDRARTISVAIDGTRGADDIVTPGHVFPLMARDGGVLVRAGHTEAAVDISRLAGLNPSGVICEIMNDDGTMARMDDLIAFARLHKLKMGTIRDLIAYRREKDNVIERRAERNFESRHGGMWKAIAFFNKATEEETLALVKGTIDPDTPTLVRMHSLALLPDIFAEKSERGGMLERSMDIIGEKGSGVVVLINRAERNYVSKALKAPKPPSPAQSGDDPPEQRNYGGGAQILADLGVRDMVLLSNTKHSMVALEGYGLSIVGERAIRLTNENGSGGGT